MLTSIRHFQEPVEKSEAVNLERTIQDLSKNEGIRKASRRQIEHRYHTLLGQICDQSAADIRLERILQGNELTDINYLSRGILCAKSVCRIAIRDRSRPVGFGTGFMVAPGVLMTNYHVLDSIELALHSVAQFRYERDIRGNELEPIEFALRIQPEPILFKDLDIALATVEPRSLSGESLDQFGWSRLSPQPGKAFIGEYLTIIQHPNGERKQICVRENKLIKYSENGPYLWYQTDTAGGSSGSAVYNNSWEVVAIHHKAIARTKKIGGRDVYIAKSGKPWIPDMGDDQIVWIANEGVRISRIVEYLEAQHGRHPITRAILSAAEPPTDEMYVNGSQPSSEIQVRSDNRGNTRILVPIEIGVSLGLWEKQSRGTAGEPPMSPPPIDTETLPTEKIVIDQTNYAKRNGFDPGFLGGGLTVPLPAIISNKLGTPQPLKGKKATELRYWNYSAVMNSKRRLAYFSAANINPDKFRGKRAKGDTWYPDERIDDSTQVGSEFYKHQKEFEADRTNNPFDQGHLTSRDNLQWGDTEKEAKRNGDDSFHYTNCAPQHWQFNQNNKASGLWNRLEVSAIKTLSSGEKLCIFNGPIFDAPLSKFGPDGRAKLNVRGKRHIDGTFGGVQIPKQFFKVIVYRRGRDLKAKAFVVSQEELLNTIDRYYPPETELATLTDLETNLYQVRIPDLEYLTNLSFGDLSKFDVPAGEESLALAEGLPIEDEGEIEF